MIDRPMDLRRGRREAVFLFEKHCRGMETKLGGRTAGLRRLRTFCRVAEFFGSGPVYAGQARDCANAHALEKAENVKALPIKKIGRPVAAPLTISADNHATFRRRDPICRQSLP
jgi:hypothetical protein